MQLIKLKPNKYKNKKVEVKGRNFDSKLEGNVYLKILDLARTHNLKYRLQPSYELVEKFGLNGKNYRSIIYRGDFELEINGKLYTLDCKGFETKEFMLKKKLFAYKFKREIICIKSVRDFEKWFREEIKK